MVNFRYLGKRSTTVKAGNFVTFFALFNFFLKNSFRLPKIFSGRKLEKKWA
jgi:hypothetical protein